MKWHEGRVINRLALPITRACNRNCPECAARNAAPPRNPREPHVSVDELKWVGKTLGPIGKIEMTGGEPTLHPDFQEISEHIHEWFQCQDIMLLTNGYLFNAQDKLPLLLNFDRIYISWYTNNFVLKHGTESNTEAVNFIEDYLKKNGKWVWIQRMDAHDRIGKPPYKGVCPPHCQYDKGDSLGYNRGQLYGCCTAYGLPYRGKGILLTEDWRDHLTELELPCEQCFLSGERHD